MSVLELTKRLRKDPELAARMLRLCEPPQRARMLCNTDAVPILAPLLAGRDTEALVCVALNGAGYVIDAAILTQGSPQATVVDPVQILRWALTRKAVPRSIILAHNHPGGDPTPSVADIDVTKQVAKAAKVVGLLLLEHLIWADPEQVYSFVEHGVMPPT